MTPAARLTPSRSLAGFRENALIRRAAISTATVAVRASGAGMLIVAAGIVGRSPGVAEAGAALVALACGSLVGASIAHARCWSGEAEPLLARR